MGKVEIRSSCHIYVSISYSYPYIVCIIDNQPIGIDIEEMKTLIINIWRKILQQMNLTK